MQKEQPAPVTPVVSTTAEPMPAVDPTFGQQGGATVTNKSSVLDEVDVAIGVASPPSVEYILVRPSAGFRIPFTDYGVCFNTYGHAAVRYTLNGKPYLMNISGKKVASPMVNFLDPREYLFGTGFSPAEEQRGVYNREMVSVRVEDVDEDKVAAMHQYFLDLSKREAEDQSARFIILPPPLVNAVRWLFPTMAERGNCAYWTSKGLVCAGLLPKVSLWPKSIFIQLFERGDGDNTHVVMYKRIRHANRSYGLDLEPLEAVTPQGLLRNVAYWELGRFANVSVEVPPGSMTAQVVKHPDAAPPSAWRNFLNSKPVVLTGTAVSLSIAMVLSGARRRALAASSMSRAAEAAAASRMARWRRILNQGSD